MNFIKTFFLILVLLSCATPYREADRESDFAGVSMDAKGDSPSFLPSIEDTISEAQSYGPAPIKIEQTESAEGQKKKALALILSPGLYRSIAQLALLREFERSSVDLHMLSGVGFGAIVAALYACGKTPEKIEWIFYKFYSRAKDIAPHSEKWFKVLETTLQGELGDKRIEQANKVFILPLFDTSKQELVLFKKGPLVKLLIDNMRVTPKLKSNYLSTIRHKIYFPKTLKKMGADLVLGVNVLNERLFFETQNSEQIKTYVEASRHMSTGNEGLDEYLKLNLEEFALDTRKISDMLVISEKRCREIVANLLKKLDFLGKNH